MIEPQPLDLDHDREQRTGFPEVVFGQGKTPTEIQMALESIASKSGRALATRVDAHFGEEIAQKIKDAQWHSRSRCISIERVPAVREGQVAVVCAGTSDLPVAQEAVLTAEMAGCQTELIVDVGVAGLHRILAHEDFLRSCHVLVVVAGMEGALPSVVAGRVSVPVIAVPTSVGYGASFDGLAALLGMLNSCAPGISVVNIDNGFGAGLVAARINQLACHGQIKNLNEDLPRPTGDAMDESHGKALKGQPKR
ncbi:MAG: nickel pincer cofactor biosynthesis protein LarB [Planctomycetia bacterium]|nr:nickel pincer cofactor biosynthesis protein LarB [Planctomycetia bacterium]